MVASHNNGREHTDLNRNPAALLRLVWQPLQASVFCKTAVSECHLVDMSVKYSDQVGGGGLWWERIYLALTYLDKYPTGPSNFL